MARSLSARSGGANQITQTAQGCPTTNKLPDTRLLGNENCTVWVVFSLWEGRVVSADCVACWRADGSAGRIIRERLFRADFPPRSSEFQMQTTFLFRSGALFALVASVAIAVFRPSTLSADDKKDEGWIPLFNGKDL